MASKSSVVLGFVARDDQQLEPVSEPRSEATEALGKSSQLPEWTVVLAVHNRDDDPSTREPED